MKHRCKQLWLFSPDRGLWGMESVIVWKYSWLECPLVVVPDTLTGVCDTAPLQKVWIPDVPIMAKKSPGGRRSGGGPGCKMADEELEWRARSMRWKRECRLRQGRQAEWTRLSRWPGQRMSRGPGQSRLHRQAQRSRQSPPQHRRA